MTTRPALPDALRIAVRVADTLTPVRTAAADERVQRGDD